MNWEPFISTCGVAALLAGAMLLAGWLERKHGGGT